MAISCFKKAISCFKNKNKGDSQDYDPTIHLNSLQDYIPKRLDEQTRWYDKKANENKEELSRAQGWTVIFSLFISSLSIISLVVPSFYANILTVTTGILGTAIISIETWTRMKKTEEIQRNYRQTCEKLKQEKLLYQSENEPYNKSSDEENLKLLVRRCESIMSYEQGIWAQLKEN